MGEIKGWSEKFTTADAVGDNNFLRKGSVTRFAMRQQSLSSPTERRLKKCIGNGGDCLEVINRRDRIHLYENEGIKGNIL